MHPMYRGRCSRLNQAAWALFQPAASFLHLTPYSLPLYPQSCPLKKGTKNLSRISIRLLNFMFLFQCGLESTETPI